MDVRLIMNELDGIGCTTMQLITDNIDNYNNETSVNYLHSRPDSQQAKQQMQQNHLSDCTVTNVDKLIIHGSNGACASPIGSSITTGYGVQSRFKISPNTYHEIESVNQGRAEGDLDSAFPPKKLYTDDIPVLDSFPGFYGFDLYRPLCGDTYEASETKPSTAFFYFKDEQGWTNLYAKKTPTWWTLSYWCKRKPPDGAFIRLTPVYGASDKQQEVIQRCFEDFMAIPTTGMSRYSIVMVGNSLAEYFFDPTTERLCVTLPYETPKEGCEYSQFNGKFMCFNSCLYNGGQGNKKPLFLIITLERLITGSEPSKGHCEVLGRQCIKFRSCACPKRDKENSERRTGDSLLAGLHNSGKRKKDTERNDKLGKRPRGTHERSNTTQNMNYDMKEFQNQRTDQRWLPSPKYDLLAEDNCNDSQFLPESLDYTPDPDLENGQTVINFNGETYNLLLVPTSLPGAIETLTSVRLGLIRTWIYSLTKLINNNKSPILLPTNDFLDLTDLKRDNRILNANTTTTSSSGIATSTTTTTGSTIMSATTQIPITTNLTAKNGQTDRRHDPDSRYFNQMHLLNAQSQYPQSQAKIGNTLSQLNKDESHLAALVRERIHLMNVCQPRYHLGSESTDSQPNSAMSGGGIGFCSGTTDESVPTNGDYFHPTNINTNNNNSNSATSNILLNTDKDNNSNENNNNTSNSNNVNTSQSLGAHLTTHIHNLNCTLTPTKKGRTVNSPTTTSTNTTTETTTTSSITTVNGDTTVNIVNGDNHLTVYPGPDQINWSYDIDQVIRNGGSISRDQLYTAMNDSVRMGELLETYTAPQLAQSLAVSPDMKSSPMSISVVHTTQSQQQRHPHHLQYQQQQRPLHSSAFTNNILTGTTTAVSSVVGLAPSTTTSLEPKSMINTNSSVQNHVLMNTHEFGNEFSSSTFYTTAYFSSQSPELEQPNMLDSITVNGNLNLCNYMNPHSSPIHQLHRQPHPQQQPQQTHQQQHLPHGQIMQTNNHIHHPQHQQQHRHQHHHHQHQHHHHPANLADALLITNDDDEDTVSCLEKKKCYDEQDNMPPVMLSRHLQSPSFCTSSSHSPDSGCCEKVIKMEI